MFRILNKFEICSYLKFVRILFKIIFLFRIKFCFHSKSEQISKFKLFKFQKRKQEKTVKKKKQLKALPRPAQYQPYASGAH
jgi:hypothetical protein